MARKPTPAQLALMARAAEGPLYVYRAPDRPGSGITPASLDIALKAGWVTLGPYEPLKGRRLNVTEAGRVLLPAVEQKEDDTDA